MRKGTAVLLALSMLFCGGCQKVAQPTGGNSTESVQTASIAEQKPPAEVRLMAVGDNLIHSTIYKQAKERGGDTYDFDYAYKNIEEVIALGDLPIINQETVIAPAYEPSDYPCFNSPPELGQKMIDLGFKAFNHANNHTLDRGISGLESMFKYWAKKRKKYDIVNTGVYKNEQDLNTVKTLTVNDITFSFIGATEHTNGIPMPSDTDVELIYLKDEDTIKEQIKLAEAASDVVVMNVHWGVEDSHTVTDAQRSLAKKMVKWGADIIIGTHPHVLQEIEMLKNSDGKKVPVIYSLGNFISAQSEAPNMIGGVADMQVTKDYETGEITVSKVKMMPVINHYDAGFKNLRIYPYYMYTEELAGKHGVRSYDSRFSYSYIEDTVNEIIGKKYLKKKLV